MEAAGHPMDSSVSGHEVAEVERPTPSHRQAAEGGVDDVVRRDWNQISGGRLQDSADPVIRGGFRPVEPKEVAERRDQVLRFCHRKVDTTDGRQSEAHYG